MLKFSNFDIVKHEYNKFYTFSGTILETKKAPVQRPGQRHLDYGMMFSGHIENTQHCKGKKCSYDGEIMEKTLLTRYPDVFRTL